MNVVVDFFPSVLQSVEQSSLTYKEFFKEVITHSIDLTSCPHVTNENH